MFEPWPRKMRVHPKDLQKVMEWITEKGLPHVISNDDKGIVIESFPDVIQRAKEKFKSLDIEFL